MREATSSLEFCGGGTTAVVVIEEDSIKGSPCLAELLFPRPSQQISRTSVHFLQHVPVVPHSTYFFQLKDFISSKTNVVNTISTRPVPTHHPIMIYNMSKPLCVALLALALGSPNFNGANLPSDHLSKRQSTEGGYGGIDPSAYCNLVVRANKGQAYKHTQVTKTMQCGGATCTAGDLEEQTFVIEAGIDFSAEDVASLSAGVVEEWTSGTENTCQGTPGQTICTWLKTAYTVYELGYDDTAFGASCGSDFEAKYPNADNAGGDYYCVTGAQYCRSTNSAYWE